MKHEVNPVNNDDDRTRTQNESPHAPSGVNAIIPGVDIVPGVHLDEAGSLLAEGKVKDAVFRLFAPAKSRIDRNEVMDLKENGPRIWEHIRMVREEEFKPNEEDHVPDTYPGHSRHMRRAIIQMRANREAVVTAFDFGFIRERYLSAY